MVPTSDVVSTETRVVEPVIEVLEKTFELPAIPYFDPDVIIEAT